MNDNIAVKIDHVSKYFRLPTDSTTSLRTCLLYTSVTIFSGLLPTSVNLQLPAIALVIVGIISFGVRWLLKRQFNIQSALVAQPRR